MNMLKRVGKLLTGNTAQVWLILSLSLPHSHLRMTTTTTSLKSHLSTHISRDSEQSIFFSMANHGILYTQLMVAVELTCRN